MSDSKACSKCGQVKPTDEFTPDPRHSSGFQSQCKECSRANSRSWYERKGRAQWDVGEITLECKHCLNPFTYVKTTGPRRQYCSQRCRANAALAQENIRRSHARRRCQCGSDDVANVGKPVCPNCKKEKRWRSEDNRKRRLALYGLSQIQFDELLAVQRGQCGVCATDSPGARGWFIDHDHSCCPGLGSCGNCVRGLLCHDCNLLLGHAKDRLDVLEQAKKYLVSNSQFKLKLQVVK